jgi:hypothetical protein
MNYPELNSQLLARVPEVFGGYAELKAMWDGDEPGPHVLYEDVLVPYLIKLLQRQEAEIALLSAFAFLEELAVSEDSEVRNVLGASVLEALNEDQGIRAAAREYMGPSTKRLAEEIEGGVGSYLRGCYLRPGSTGCKAAVGERPLHRARA